MPDFLSLPVPEELIAQTPAIPRDSSRLLVLEKNSGKISEDTFRNIGKYLPPKSVLVLNKTKVVPARVRVTTESGSVIELLYTRHDERNVFALSPKKLKANDVLHFGNHKLIVKDFLNAEYKLEPNFDMAELPKILETYGNTPIPPYIKNSKLPEAELRVKYQTVFAKTSGSVAAPTASLHFTPELLDSLKKAGHTLVFVTLHVGTGTFMNPTAEQIKKGILHEEWFEISSETAQVINACHDAGRKIIPVGTTALRTLETIADESGVLREASGTTDIFIKPGYHFKIADAMITNFHVPNSSLRMLVAAFAGEENMLKSYNYAIANRFRFFSFGDAMLII